MPVTLTHAYDFLCSLLMPTPSGHPEVGDSFFVTSPDGRTATLFCEHTNGQFAWIGTHRIHVRDDKAKEPHTWMLRGFKFDLVQ